jgi:AraC-like DNA-binding protein
MTPLLQAWEHTCTVASESFVLPDGCQDLIGVQLPNEKPRWFIASLSDRLYRVASQENLRYVGYRFTPGTCFDDKVLLKQIDGANLEDKVTTQIAINECVHIDPRVAEALGALACEPTLKAVRQQLGVGERTLQRLLSTSTSRTATYWKRLARWRQSAYQLATDAETPLLQVAADHGYFDQAHMNLEFRRWLGISPSAFQSNPALCRLARDSGFGT